MAANVAPPRGRGAASHTKQFAAGFANGTDLLAQSGMPQHPAQLVDFHNAGSAYENAVYVTQQGQTVTKPIAPGQTYPVETPVATLNTSGADVSATVYYWHGNSVPINA